MADNINQSRTISNQSDGQDSFSETENIQTETFAEGTLIDTTVETTDNGTITTNVYSDSIARRSVNGEVRAIIIRDNNV